MAVPPVLLDPAFAPLWARAADRLDRFGPDWRGDLPLPPDLPSTVYARLGEVLDRRFPTTKRRLDLAAFERRLEQRYGTDLAALLAAAGHPPTGRREAKVAALAQRDATGAALAQAARDELGGEPWVGSWSVAVRSGIADPERARWAALVVARVLRASGEQRSRGEVAARALGSAHLLDRGTPERRWVRAALAHRAGAPDRDDADLWADAGLPGDVVSAPVLTWALPLLGDGVAAAVRALTAAGSPAPLTTLTLRDLAVAVPPGTVVLSVENPRLLEAAAARRLDAPVLCTAGEPTTAATLLVGALLAAGAVVRHHGDLDPAGLAIAGRLADRGVVPWRMTADDYRAAVAAATAAGVELPEIDPTRIPDTPWDPGLAAALHHHRVAVEEERVLDELLDDHRRPPARSGA